MNVKELLTEDALVSCTHGGTAKLRATQSAVKVGGKAVLLAGGLPVSYTQTPCSLQTPCVTAREASPHHGVAVRGAPPLTRSSLVASLNAGQVPQGRPLLLTPPPVV